MKQLKALKKRYSLPFSLTARLHGCLKKDKCDFKHPQRLHLNQPSSHVPKHTVRCPFLSRRGYCLKGDQCDFLHSNILSFPSTKRPDVMSHTHYSPFLFHKQRIITPNLLNLPRNRNTQAPPIYPAAPWSAHPRLKPLMDIPTYQLW